MREEFEKWYKDTQGYSPTFSGDDSKPYYDSLEREFYNAFKAGYQLALGKHYKNLTGVKNEIR